MYKLKIGLVFFIIFGFMSCGNEPKQVRETLSDKYVYVDDAGVLHVDRRCYGIRSRVELDGRATGLRRVSRLMIEDSLLNKCCNRCITDVEYDSLKIKYNKYKLDPLTGQPIETKPSAF